MGSICPSIYKFKTAKSFRIFDAGSGRIFKVSKIIWDIIEDFRVLATNALVSKYQDKYSTDEILNACEKIREAKEVDAFLQTTNSTKFDWEAIKQEVSDLVNNNCQQLILNVTRCCNLGCSYCPCCGPNSKKIEFSRKDMTWDIAKKAIDQFISHSTTLKKRFISFYGGEPLLKLALIKKVVTYVRGKNDPDDIMFALTTNGYLLDEDTTDYLVSEGVLITISLDGPKHIHDANRPLPNGKGSWMAISKNLFHFFKKHPKYVEDRNVLINITKTPTTDIRELESFFMKSGNFPENIKLRIMQAVYDELNLPTPQPTPQSIEGLEKLRCRFIEAVKDDRFNENCDDPELKFAQEIFEKPFLNFHKRTIFSKKRINFCISTCKPGSKRLFVSPEGEYYPCERVSECSAFSIGNVETGVKAEKSWQLYKGWIESTKQDCLTCWCSSFCQIGCFANIRKWESLSSEKQKQCDDYRRGAHNLLVQYCEILEANPSAFNYMKNITIM